MAFGAFFMPFLMDFHWLIDAYCLFFMLFLFLSLFPLILFRFPYVSHLSFDLMALELLPHGVHEVPVHRRSHHAAPSSKNQPFRRRTSSVWSRAALRMVICLLDYAFGSS